MAKEGENINPNSQTNNSNNAPSNPKPQDNRKSPGALGRTKQDEFFTSDKLSGSNLMSVIPKEMIPTKVTPYIIGTLFTIAILWGIFSIVFSAFSGDLLDFDANKVDEEVEIGIKIQIGWPWVFLEFDFDKIESFPLKWTVIPTIFLYFLIGYSIDILLSVLGNFVSTDPNKKKRISAKPKLQKIESNKKPI